MLSGVEVLTKPVEYDRIRVEEKKMKIDKNLLFVSLAIIIALLIAILLACFMVWPKIQEQINQSDLSLPRQGACLQVPFFYLLDPSPLIKVTVLGTDILHFF